MAATSVVLFDEREEVAVRGCLEALERRRPEIHRAVSAHLGALESIARAVSAFPPILREQRLGRRSRSVETLVEALRDLDETNRELRTAAALRLARIWEHRLDCDQHGFSQRRRS